MKAWLFYAEQSAKLGYLLGLDAVAFLATERLVTEFSFTTFLLADLVRQKDLTLRPSLRSYPSTHPHAALALQVELSKPLQALAAAAGPVIISTPIKPIATAPL